METNHVPAIDWSKCEPGCCCPEFIPDDWDNLELHFRDKRFVRDMTHSLFHIPYDMGATFARTFSAIKAAHADEKEFVVLSDDSSMWRGEHYFNVTREVPDAENVTLSGDYLTHVFEGPYSDARRWVEEIKRLVAQRGRRMGRLFFYYTTCPKCAKQRGKNYVVGIAELAATN